MMALRTSHNGKFEMAEGTGTSLRRLKGQGQVLDVLEPRILERTLREWFASREQSLNELEKGWRTRAIILSEFP